jgi:DnaK suppressor protein
MDRRLSTGLKKTLEAKHRELRAGLGKTQREAHTGLHDYGKDEGDRAVASISREIDASQKSRDRSLLAAVDGALKRIKDGTFGECLNCGQEISAKRLEAIPWVRYCITCQELIDSGIDRSEPPLREHSS